MLVLASSLVLTPGPLFILYLLLHVTISISFSLRCIVFNVKPLDGSPLLITIHALRPLFCQHVLFLMEHTSHFLVNLLMFDHLLVLLVFPNRSHHFNVGEGSLTLLVSFTVSLVLSLGLLTLNHLELLFFMHLFHPQLVFLLFLALSAQHLLLCDLLLFLKLLLLLRSSFLGPLLLFELHSLFGLSLFLF